MLTTQVEKKISKGLIKKNWIKKLENAGIEESPADMIKFFLFLIVSIYTSLVSSEMITLDCSTQNSDRKLSFSLLLGTETKRAIQILKKGQLQMDLNITDKYFEIGQFTDESKQDLISVMKINKKTLKIDYAKYMELVEPILCIKI